VQHNGSGQHTGWMKKLPVADCHLVPFVIIGSAWRILVASQCRPACASHLVPYSLPRDCSAAAAPSGQPRACVASGEGAHCMPLSLPLIPVVLVTWSAPLLRHPASAAAAAAGCQWYHVTPEPCPVTIASDMACHGTGEGAAKAGSARCQ
jgi:hypothetical protein